jgi:hypothetical protein
VPSSVKIKEVEAELIGNYFYAYSVKPVVWSEQITPCHCLCNASRITPFTYLVKSLWMVVIEEVRVTDSRSELQYCHNLNSVDFFPVYCYVWYRGQDCVWYFFIKNLLWKFNVTSTFTCTWRHSPKIWFCDLSVIILTCVLPINPLLQPRTRSFISTSRLLLETSRVSLQMSRITFYVVLKFALGFIPSVFSAALNLVVRFCCFLLSDLLLLSSQWVARVDHGRWSDCLFLSQRVTCREHIGCRNIHLLFTNTIIGSSACTSKRQSTTDPKTPVVWASEWRVFPYRISGSSLCIVRGTFLWESCGFFLSWK